MSYDLYFVVKNDSAGPSREAMLDYFSSRELYLIKEDFAFYENEDTGVYFNFLCVPDSEPEAIPGGLREVCTFNVNYFRPHVFALEAYPEVDAFVREFGFGTYDPQEKGMDTGPLTEEGFLKGWNWGNRLAYRTFLVDQTVAAQTYSFPSAGIHDIWMWNRRRQSYNAALGDYFFVPTVIFGVTPSGLRTSVVVGVPIPAAVPEVDFVIISPRDWLTGNKQDDLPDFVPVRAGALLKFFKCLRRLEAPLEHAIVEPLPPCPALELFVRRAVNEMQSFEPVSVEKVLDAELIDSVKGDQKSSTSPPSAHDKRRA